MLFFRAVIYLFIQENVYLYIVYWGLAGSRLKNPCLCNAASHHETRSRMYLLWLLIWHSLSLPALSIWILSFQKFRWEVLTVKYAPRKVYIKKDDGYVELSYKDFCRRRQSDQNYMDKLFIPVQVCLLEVVRKQYVDFYKEKERWRYDIVNRNVSVIVVFC